MEKLTSLHLSFDKILIQIVIPGLISIFPWFLFYLNFHPKAKTYFLNNSSGVLIGLIFLSLITGMFLENLGSKFEVLVYDRRNKVKFENYFETWNKFLQLSYKEGEPIGQRYLRNILFRMKFELSSGLALIPMSIGLLFQNNHNPIFNNKFLSILILLIFPLLLCIYLLFFEGYSSSKILAKTRSLLVEKYYKEI